MIFGKVQTRNAHSCILAHSLRLPDGRIRKGTVLNSEHIEKLLSNNIAEITAATLEDGDIHEDEAARLLAESLVGEGIKIGRASTGRVNCYATVTGLLTIPREKLLAINNVSESITASTLQENRWVDSGKMVATIKIIPYAVTEKTLRFAVELCDKRTQPLVHSSQPESQYSNALSVHEAENRNAYLLQTTMHETPSSILEKTERVTERRLAMRNVRLIESSLCDHESNVLSQKLLTLSKKISKNQSHDANSWILISGASAISDRQDVIPHALEAAGGTVTRCGIPVDPGNLLMLGYLGDSTVIGIPGCARSPKPNGLDLFMDRLACNLPITTEWINSLAIGGLMDEIIDRPTPRSQTKTMIDSLESKDEQSPYPLTAVLLAGGSSKRFGKDNKLFAKRDELPLIAHALNAIINSQVQRLIIVLGYAATEVKDYCTRYLDQAMNNRAIDVEFSLNNDFESGMGSSLKVGISSLLNYNIKSAPSEPHAALICLADMPSVNTDTIDTLMKTMQQSRENESLNFSNKQASAFVPVFQGERGNPVILMPELFDLILDIEGDFGARRLLQANRDSVNEVSVQDSGILLDFDTPDQLRQSETDSI